MEPAYVPILLGKGGLVEGTNVAGLVTMATNPEAKEESRFSPTPPPFLVLRARNIIIIK